MARIRSPNYPAMSLPEIIKRTALVFAKEHRHPMPREVLARHMGYNGINGASLSAISAGLKYGLIETDGGDYRVTDRAISILHPRTPMEKGESILAAAREPALFADILNDFRGTPPSDDNLRSYLIRKNFGQGALTPVIQAFRETMDLVSAESGGYGAATDVTEHTPAPPPMPHTTAQSDFKPTAPPPPSGSPFSVSLLADRLVVSGTLLDRETVDKLIQILMATKNLLPDSQEKVTLEELRAYADELMEPASLARSRTVHG